MNLWHQIIKLRKTNLSILVSVISLFFISSCNESPSSSKLDGDICYYSLDFSGLPAPEKSKLPQISMNIHDNYFLYKNLYVIPLRVDDKIFLSLDCNRGLDGLELDKGIRDVIDNSVKITEINEEEYILIYERSTDGKMTVD